MGKTAITLCLLLCPGFARADLACLTRAAGDQVPALGFDLPPSSSISHSISGSATTRESECGCPPSVRSSANVFPLGIQCIPRVDCRFGFTGAGNALVSATSTSGTGARDTKSMVAQPPDNDSLSHASLVALLFVPIVRGLKQVSLGTISTQLHMAGFDEAAGQATSAMKTDAPGTACLINPPCGNRPDPTGLELRFRRSSLQSHPLSTVIGPRAPPR